MAKPLVTNNAYSTLAGSISNSDLSLSVATGEGARFPNISGSDYFYVTLIDTSNNMEIVKVTAKSTDAFTIVRAQDGTSARAFSASDRVELRPTAALFEEAAAGGYLDSASIPADTITTTHITDSNVTLDKIQDISDNIFLGNDSGGAAAPEELSVTTATAMLNAFVGDSGSGGTKGLVPAPSANDGDSDKQKFLAADGTYKVPGWQFVEEVVGDGSSQYLASTVDLTDFDLVRITLIVVPSTAAGLKLQVATSGPTWITTSTYLTYSVWVDHNTTGGGADADGDAGVDTGINIIDSAWTLDGSPSMNYAGRFEMTGLKSGEWLNVFAGNAYYESGVNSGLTELREFAGNQQSTSALTNLRIALSTGVHQTGSNMLIEGFRFG